MTPILRVVSGRSPRGSSRRSSGRAPSPRPGDQPRRPTTSKASGSYSGLARVRVGRRVLARSRSGGPPGSSRRSRRPGRSSRRPSRSASARPCEVMRGQPGDDHRAERHPDRRCPRRGCAGVHDSSPGRSRPSSIALIRSACSTSRRNRACLNAQGGRHDDDRDHHADDRDQDAVPSDRLLRGFGIARSITGTRGAW